MPVGRPGPTSTFAPIDLLFVCTANQCRSPMAEALFRVAAERRGLDLSVGSAGLLPGGMPPPDEVIGVMADIGVDVSGHVSQQVTPALLDDTALVVTMTKQHVVSIVGDHLEAWPKVFRLHDLLGRTSEIGARSRDEDLAPWVARLHAGRRASDVLALDTAGDVPDPIGQRRRAYEQVRDALAEGAAALASAIGGDPSVKGRMESV